MSKITCEPQAADNFHNSSRRRRPNCRLLLLINVVVVAELCNLILSYSRPINDNNFILIKNVEAQQQSILQQQQQNNNNNLPQYQQHNNILHFVVPEGAPIGTFLGNIRSADGQVPVFVLPLQATTPERELMAALQINFTNGDLTTNSILDREYREMYQFVGIVKEPFAEIKCTVTVKDVNDNAPMFLLPNVNETNFVIEMPEGQRGLRRQLPLAVDFDTPLFGIKEFRIVSGNTPSGTFQLVEHEAPARTSLQQQYQQQQNNNQLDDLGSSIVAAGADNPQLMQQLAQQATVLIPSQPMQSTLSAAPSSTSSQQQQQQQQQYQQQQQQQQQQQYQQVSSSNNAAAAAAALASTLSPQSKFLIDLEVNQLLDRENQSSYQLVVEAIDGGQPPMLGRLMVTVNVQDVNDNDPIFTRKLYECHFKEDTSKRTLLMRVQAHDADLEANGQLTYLIKRHSSSSSSSSQPTTVVVNGNGGNSSSSDNNNDASTSTGRYNNNNNKRPLQPTPSTAFMGPINNKSTQQQQQQRSPGPTLQQQGGNEIYEQNIDSPSYILAQGQASNNYQTISNSKPTTAAGSANTNNKQAAANYLQQQDNQPASSSMFEIDPIKGEIYLAHQLDYELDQMHELLIEARDHGKPARSGYATVKVFVIDVNDDPPPTININSRQQQQQQQQQQQFDNEKRLLYGNSSSSEASRSGELFGSPGGGSSRLIGDSLLDGGGGGGQNLFTSINLTNWFTQINSSLLFVIVLVALLSLLFPLCLVKIKSRQLESDYTDTAGLTLTSNNGQLTKQSPNHSTSNEHSNGSPGNNDTSYHHHHNHRHLHDPQHHQRSRVSNGYAGLNGAHLMDGSATGLGFGSLPSAGGEKMRYQYTDSSNLYHNPYPLLAQSRHNNTSTLNSHHHHNHHDHHQQQPPDSPLSHQMAIGGGGSAGGTTSRGGTLATQAAAAAAASTAAIAAAAAAASAANAASAAALPVGPTTPSSQQLQPLEMCFDFSGAATSSLGRQHHHHHHHHQQQQQQLNHNLQQQQLISYGSQDWCGSYNWDYLSDWVPEYHTIMPLLPRRWGPPLPMAPPSHRSTTNLHVIKTHGQVFC